MIRYVFREDEPLRIKAAGKADPQVIGEALAEIQHSAGGLLTPKAVVEAARQKKHPLHPHFEWDDNAAAESWRQEQARNLIRIVRTEDIESPGHTTRAFVSITEKEGTAYRHVAEVKRSVDLQIALLRQAERDLEAFERRYRELSDICSTVRSAREQVKRRMDKLENRAAA